MRRGLAGTRATGRGTATCPQCQGRGQVPGPPIGKNRGMAACPLCGGLNRVDVMAACRAGWSGSLHPIVNLAANELLTDDD